MNTTKDFLCRNWKEIC